MVHFSQHQIASGFNNVAGYDYVGELVGSDGLQFSEPVGANHGFNPGKVIVRLDGLTATAGKNKQTFVMGMSFAQYIYLQDTYLGGGFSGKVTVRTRWMDNAWDDYNAILTIQSEGMPPVWGGYREVQWTYSDLRVVA